MAQSRAPTFGPEYEQLLLTAFASLPFSFPLESPRHVKAFSAKVYQYFRVLRQENLRLDLIEMADSLTLCGDGNSLVFQLKEDNWDNALIRNVLGLAKGFHKTGESTTGNELQLPDLLQTRLMRQVSAIRERKAGSTSIVPPHKL